MLKRNVSYFKEFVKEFKTTGSCAASSRWAAKVLSGPITDSPRPRMRVLELGPGTGSVTTQIIRNMNAEDTLRVCEINPRFMGILKARLSGYPHYFRHQDRISFYLGNMLDLPEEEKYDLIVCALPFLNFDIETVRMMFEKLSRLSHPNTLMTYFEYIGLRHISLKMAPKPTKVRMREIDSFFDRVHREAICQKEYVWLNLLPITVYTMRPASAPI